MLPEDTNAKMDVRILHEITIRHQSSDDLLLLRGAKGEEARDQASCLQIRGEILFLILTCMCDTGKGTAPNDSVWHLVLKFLKEITSSSSSS
jgi:hypothetical protein